MILMNASIINTYCTPIIRDWMGLSILFVTFWIIRIIP